MLFETKTSIYRLEEKREGGFRLTKIALKQGKASTVGVGESSEGDKVTITPQGVYCGEMKTSSLILPVVD